MWTYKQEPGDLLLNNEHVAFGYSGGGEGKNNPAMQDIHDVGPIPRGRYRIELIADENNNPVDYEHKKAPVIRLVPDPTNEMFGRDGFLIHGDSISQPGTASEGCIIMAHWVRQNILQSRDLDLAVIE
jgi:type VI secretion system (T6SS) effector TldE1-like protein